MDLATLEHMARRQAELFDEGDDEMLATEARQLADRADYLFHSTTAGRVDEMERVRSRIRGLNQFLPRGWMYRTT